MLLPIVHAGEPVLRQQARALSPKEIKSKEIQKVIEHMRETMRGAPGVGLAAPQVGLSLQLAVIEDRKEYHKDVSAEQLARPAFTKKFACLSLTIASPTRWPFRPSSSIIRPADPPAGFLKMQPALF